MRRKVVVTGTGVVSGLGRSVDEFTANLMAGTSAVRETTIMTPWGEPTDPFWAAQLPDDFAAPDVPSSLTPFADRNSQFALDAAHQALEQAAFLGRDRSRLGRGIVIVGVGMAGQTTINETFSSMYLERKKRVHPFTVPRIMPSAPNSMICMRYGLTAPGFAVSSACASSNHALGLAYEMLKSGMADWAIAGGTEAGITHTGIASWRAMRVTSPSYSAPFSEGPLGMTIGEGAGMVVLETEEHAARFGVDGLCEFAGFGMTSDGCHMTQMNMAVAGEAVAAALADAGITAAAVDYINAHGTGTELNDRCEAEVIAHVYGEHAERIPVSSTKAAHGHCIAATSALEFIASMQSIRQHRAPPTANFTGLRAGIQLNVVRERAHEDDIDTVVSHAFGFGGLNAIVVLRRNGELHAR
jgi:nodulation protein E